MKAVQIVKPEQLEIIEIEKPVIDNKNNVLIKMTAAGICGSDIGIYHGTNAAATYPRIIGHEMVGRVEEVGPDVQNLKPGDRVIVNQVTSCGECYPCKKGRGNVCDHLAVRGVHIDGGYREYITVPESDCYILPDSLSDQDAVMIEPTTIAIQSCTRAELEKDDMLLLYGIGALGSSILKIARQLCDYIIVADVVNEKLEEAKKAGALNTHFNNPHGLPDDNHYTTPYDMAMLARKAMSEKVIREIVSTKSIHRSVFFLRLPCVLQIYF